ncbi:glycosyltransferase [Flavihumibacter sp. R14]|nr:glycosyltransferase [Flavihumibacter soli]
MSSPVSNSHIRLAIVIPYFKKSHFEETLVSINNQTDSRFKLYIGNDNSPDSPVDLINKTFNENERILYRNFTSNLGSSSLTRQWERCIDLADEEYIWLFSDDDIMPEDAVERFYKMLADHSSGDLFRYNVQIINERNDVIYPVSQHPPHETAYSFLNRRLNGETISTACEYIFSKKIYSTCNGFVEFPLAWASDDATWLNYSIEKGIYSIPGPCVSWRMGGNNISSKNNNYKKKAIACINFIAFVSSKFHVKEDLKLKWLIAQIKLLGQSKKIKLYFWAKILLSGIFSINFLLRSYKNILGDYHVDAK